MSLILGFFTASHLGQVLEHEVLLACCPRGDWLASVWVLNWNVDGWAKAEDHELGELLVESELLRAMAGGHERQCLPTHADVMDEMIRFVVDASIKPTCFFAA